LVRREVLVSQTAGAQATLSSCIGFLSERAGFVVREGLNVPNGTSAGVGSVNALVSCTSDFFFSSRRRHTRLVSDWSSDVCSSDLDRALHDVIGRVPEADDVTSGLAASSLQELVAKGAGGCLQGAAGKLPGPAALDQRSEERRVGKEGRGGGAEGAWKRKRGAEGME